MAQTEMPDVWVDTPDDVSYQSAYTWEPVDVEVVDEPERVFHFDKDEHLNVLMDRED